MKTILKYIVIIVQMLLLDGMSFGQNLDFGNNQYTYLGDIDSAFLYKIHFDTNEYKNKFIGSGYYLYRQNKRVFTVFSRLNNDSIGFRVMFYPNGALRYYANYKGLKPEGKLYYFDTKGNLTQIILYSNYTETTEYLIKGHHIRMKVNHRARKGTRRTWCFRRISKEDREFVEMLKGDPLVIKNCSTQ
jgi:antitoxin component YwqK of YwqJK toxin-antitoxin module